MKRCTYSISLHACAGMQYVRTYVRTPGQRSFMRPQSACMTPHMIQSAGSCTSLPVDTITAPAKRQAPVSRCVHESAAALRQHEMTHPSSEAERYSAAKPLISSANCIMKRNMQACCTQSRAVMQPLSCCRQPGRLALLASRTRQHICRPILAWCVCADTRVAGRGDDISLSLVIIFGQSQPMD